MKDKEIEGEDEEKRGEREKKKSKCWAGTKRCRGKEEYLRGVGGLAMVVVGLGLTKPERINFCKKD